MHVLPRGSWTFFIVEDIEFTVSFTIKNYRQIQASKDSLGNETMKLWIIYCCADNIRIIDTTVVSNLIIRVSPILI